MLVFFAPSFNIALALEQLARREEHLPTLVLWATVFGLTLTPAAVYGIGLFVLNVPAAVDPLCAFAIWWALTAIISFFLVLVQGGSSGIASGRISAAATREWLVVFAAFLGVLLVNLVLYRYIPEADGYGYLVKLREAAITPLSLVAEPRILFLIIVRLLASLLQIDPYWVFKIVLPAFSFIVIAAIYQLSLPVIRQPWLRVFAALAPLAFPVFLQEMLIARPQSIVVLVLAAALLCVGELLAKPAEPRQWYWVFALTAAGAVGMKVHVLFITTLFLALIIAVRITIPLFRRAPIDAIAIAVGLATLVYPWIMNTGLLSEVQRIIVLLGNAFSVVHLEAWFIDHYRNVDGIEAGWPGWTAVFYYGYNLGFFLPILLVIVLLRRQVDWKIFVRPLYVLATGLITVFLMVAELLPRFGLAFLPDRAWLFIALGVCFVLPPMLNAVSRQSHMLIVLLLGAGVLSIAAGTGITLAKQGWTTVKEYPVASFIRTQTDAHAIFLGQGGNRPLVRYFGDRAFFEAPDVFLSEDERAAEQYLEEQAVRAPVAVALKRQDIIANELIGLSAKYQREQSLDGRRAVLSALSLAVLDGRQALADAEFAGAVVPRIENVPVYIIYSNDKFSSLYGSRAWWRTFNAADANIEKFSRRYPVVYDSNGTTIWEVR